MNKGIKFNVIFITNIIQLFNAKYGSFHMHRSYIYADKALRLIQYGKAFCLLTTTISTHIIG